MDDERENEAVLPGGVPETPRCPFCGGRKTELLHAFGPHASVASYWCGSCRSPFELLKWSGGSGSSGPPER